MGPRILQQHSEADDGRRIVRTVEYERGFGFWLEWWRLCWVSNGANDDDPTSGGGGLCGGVGGVQFS